MFVLEILEDTTSVMTDDRIVAAVIPGPGPFTVFLNEKEIDPAIKKQDGLKPHQAASSNDETSQRLDVWPLED